MIVNNPFLTQAPAAYAEAAVLAETVGTEMLARLQWMTLQPDRVVDVGCGVGSHLGLLQKHYPGATVLGVDVTYPMLQYAKAQDPLYKLCCADVRALPFANHSVDVIFANLLLPWCKDLELVLREWRRVLKPNGLLMFSCLGPDTLLAWREIFSEVMLVDLMDMHDYGDALKRVGFVDPVMDVERVTLHYSQAEKMLDELVVSGFLLDQKGLLAHMAKPEDKWVADFEVIYGHAWGGADALTQTADEEGVVRFPLAYLRRK